MTPPVRTPDIIDVIAMMRHDLDELMRRVGPDRSDHYVREVVLAPKGVVSGPPS